MNQLHLAWRNASGDKAPATVSIEPTIKCNMRCPMCDREHKVDFKKHLREEVPTDVLMNNIRLLGEMGVKQILIIGGGEPLMHKDIVQIIREIKKSGMICHLWTNGTLFNKDLAEQIIPNVDILTISIDSAIEKEHDASRGVHGSFSRILNSLDLINQFRGDGLVLRFHSVISRINIHSLSSFIPFAKKHNVNELGGALINPFDFAPRSMVFDGDEEYKQAQDEINNFIVLASHNGFKLAGCYNPISDTIIEEYTKDYNLHCPSITTTTCFGLWSMSQIRPNGDVSVCCFTYKPVLGNLKESNFRDIWHSDKANKMRQSVKNGQYLDKTCIGCSLGRPVLTDMVQRCPHADEMLNHLVLKSR